MTITFAKVFSTMLDSTLWASSDANLRCFLTLLLTADRHGEVEMSIVGLAHRSRITLEECQAALESFQSPDEYSRSKNDEGRRVEEIDGGWRIINYASYRYKLSEEHRKEKAAERQKRFQERKAL